MLFQPSAVTRVVNVRSAPYDQYIGRPGLFGNPYSRAKHGKDALPLFRQYFLHRVSTDQDFRRQVLALRGKVLGCWCKPENCHGDVMAGWIDSQPEKP